MNPEKLHLEAGRKAGRERTCGNKVRYSQASAEKAAMSRKELDQCQTNPPQE